MWDRPFCQLERATSSVEAESPALIYVATATSAMAAAAAAAVMIILSPREMLNNS